MVTVAGPRPGHEPDVYGVGVIDEVIDAFLANRVFDRRDTLFSAVAGRSRLGRA